MKWVHLLFILKEALSVKWYFIKEKCSLKIKFGKEDFF